MMYESVVAEIAAHGSVDEYEARRVVDEALSANFRLDEIIHVFFYFGVDAIIVNTWSRKTFPIEGGPIRGDGRLADYA